MNTSKAHMLMWIYDDSINEIFTYSQKLNMKIDIQLNYLYLDNIFPLD